TSAGRIPSHRGYRYYVSSLMPDRSLSPQEQFTILHQFHQAARDLEAWVSLSASILANNLHNIALVTQPRVAEVRLKQLQLVELTETRALLVVVTSDAAVHQRILEFPISASQEQLSRLALRLNAELGGKTVNELPRTTPTEPLSAIEAAVLAALTELLLQEQAARVEEPIVEGVRELLRQPEFDTADRMLDALEAVDERRLREAIPARAVEQAAVAIVIGDENRQGPYQEMSFVLARYGPPGGAAGIVGLLGPTRMHYSDAVAHVRYISDVLTELIRETYGGGQ
uniref:HrcA family transcriptional regulator n=1 Tax=Tepidiforma sp. TaxID=2682230 RepID=UPI002ADDBC2B